MKRSVLSTVVGAATTLLIASAPVITVAQTCSDNNMTAATQLNNISMVELEAVDTIVLGPECPSSGFGSYRVPSNMNWHVTEVSGSSSSSSNNNGSNNATTTTTTTLEIRTTPADVLDPYIAAGNELRFRLTGLGSNWPSGASEVGVEIVVTAGAVTRFLIPGAGTSVALSLAGGTKDVIIQDLGTGNKCWVNSTTAALTFEGKGVNGNAIMDATVGGVKQVTLSGVNMDARVKGTVTTADLSGTMNALVVQGSVTSSVAGTGVSNKLFLNGQNCSDTNFENSGVNNKCEPTEEEVSVGDISCTVSSSYSHFNCNSYSAAAVSRKTTTASLFTTNTAVSFLLSLLIAVRLV